MPQTPVNLRITVGGIAVVLVVGGAAWFGFGPDPQPPVSLDAPPEMVSPATVTVHVSGFVMSPGVATVSADGRVSYAIAAAGGATSDADLSRLHLAATIRDGDHITVPGHQELGAPVVGSQVVAGGIDINNSTASQLEGLPGVGPVLASRIVAYRDSNGSFAQVEDLLDVPGIGEAKLAGMRDDIAFP